MPKRIGAALYILIADQILGISGARERR